jgi:hypothetical protein
MLANTTGSDNIAHGAYSLESNTTGYENIAIGYGALDANTVGFRNTAIGTNSMARNLSGNGNSGFGESALRLNTTGDYNSACGANSLYTNSEGSNNTANGYQALYANTTGSSNTASGHHSLQANTTGYHGTAVGAQALFSNTTGVNNTALGLGAMYSNTTGSNNVSLGVNAGYNLSTGHDDIDIANRGVSGESGTIRIGGPAQTATYIAGILSSHVTGSPVYISSTGQLGVLASSERYKTEISGMGGRSAELQRLRPVTFHLKNDPQGALQYGLIAEEVNAVDPNLVIRNERGTIEGVRYDELAPLLLNEVQQLQQQLRKQSKLVARQEKQLRAMEERMNAIPSGRYYVK